MLTPQVIEDVRRLLPTVMYMESVGDYLGVSRMTWRGWLKRGSKERKRIERARNGNKEPKESEKLYLQFFDTVKKSISEGEIFDAGTIKKASAESWQAAAWRLERRFPDRWGRKERVEHEHTGKAGKPIEFIQIIPSPVTDDAEDADRAAADS